MDEVKNQKLQMIGPKQKIAFVCSGGASKAGAFHLGVALALQEQGFRFYGGLKPENGEIQASGPMDISTFVGSSAGSIISTYLAAGYSLHNIFNSFLSRDPSEIVDEADRVPKILPKMTYQKMFKLRGGLAKENLAQFNLFRRFFFRLLAGDWEALLQLKWMKVTGLFSTSGIEQFLREEVLLSNKFQDYRSDLFIVATQLNHSRKVVFGKYKYQPPASDTTCQYDNDVGISNACAASTALPGFFSPFPIKHNDNTTIAYIDGEIRDTLSTHVAVDAGADLVIASHTHQPYHFMKEIGSLTEYGLPAILVQSLYLVIEQKIKNHIHNKQIQRNAILAVERYCKENGVNATHATRIGEILAAELHHRMEVDTIYIHPSPSDAQMFLGEHFSLSPKKLSDYVRSGFRAAIETLKRYDFADKTNKAAIGDVSANQHGS